MSDAESSIGARFYEAAKFYASRRAIVGDAGETVSYGELLQRSLRIASGLLASTNDGEQPIVIVSSQSIIAVEAILGALLAGLPYLPVDPSLPAAELIRICAAAHPAAVLSTAVRRHEPSVTGIPSLDIAELLQSRPLDSPRSVSPNKSAALFATSGTTGTPKLVALSHRAILFDIGRQTNDLYLGPDDRFDLLFSTGFSASLAPLFAALLNGAELHPLDLRDDRKDRASRLLDWIEAREITISNMTTSTFRLAAATTQSSSARCPHLRLLSLSGERVSSSDLATVRRIISPQCVLQNAMAATETRTYAQYFVVSDCHPPNPLPVGWPVWGKEVLLLDEDGRILSGPGEGEVAIRSRYLASGYMNDPQQTAER
ncbi:MAG TPA: AMP-binding protein, partial [Acidobacteriaceae bacterium]